MPPEPEQAFYWRLEGAYRTLTGEAFAKLVTENDLKVEGPFQGYFYAKLRGTDGYELYRTLCGHKWVYQARRVATQGNAAGGAVVVDITVASGQIAVMKSLYAINSGTNTLLVVTYDEDNAVSGRYAAIASAAGVSTELPSIGTAANASANIQDSYDLTIAPGTKLTIYQTGAGAQNDTLTVAVTLELYNISTLPTWSKARSTNEADVTLAASTISDANTLQEVLCA